MISYARLVLSHSFMYVSAMMPFWMFVLGRFYLHGTTVQIPYLNIIGGLFSIIIPCAIGIIVASKRPAWAKKGVIAVRPLAVVFVLWVIIVGSITNMHVYRLMARNWYVIPAGTLLPYVGMVLGYVISRIIQQGNKRAVTIAIETGMQDTGIAIILLLSSFPKPDGDIAATMPITSAMCTPFPLIISFIVLTLHTKCWLGGKCQCCGGPDAPEFIDIEKDDDVLSTTNTKNSELTPGDEKVNHLEGLKGEEHGQGDRLLDNNHEARPITNGHVVWWGESYTVRYVLVIYVLVRFHLVWCIIDCMTVYFKTMKRSKNLWSCTLTKWKLYRIEGGIMFFLWCTISSGDLCMKMPGNREARPMTYGRTVWHYNPA